MVQVTLPRWPPWLLIAKTFIDLIVQNRKTYDFETFPEALVNGALQNLYKSWTWDDPDLFYGKVSLGCISQISGDGLQGLWSSG